MLHTETLSRQRAAVALSLILFIGCVIRLDFLFSSSFVVDSDEAIVGLMARHIYLGEPVPTFYYGQHYMGSFEPLLVALLFSIFGFVPELLKVVPLLFSLVFIFIMYLLGKEFGGRRAGVYSAMLASLCPGTLVVWSAKARGGFIEIVTLAAISLLLTLYWFKEERFDWTRLGIISFLLGFGFWVNNQIVYVFPVVGMLVLVKVLRAAQPLRERLKQLSWCALYCPLLAILGGLPFWLYNLFFDFASFRQLARDRTTEISQHAVGFFENALPILIGAKRYWQTQAVFPGSVEIGYSLLCILLLAGGIGVLRNRLSLSVFLALLGTGISTAGIFIVSPYGYLSEAPRYLLPLYLVLFPLLGGGIAVVAMLNRTIGHFTLLVLLGLHLSSAYLNGKAIPGEPFIFDGQRVSKDHTELIKTLNKLDISLVRTNYWIGHRLAYETEEQVKFLVWEEPHQVRIPEYEHGLSEEQRQLTPMVLVPAQAKLVRRAYELEGHEFKEETASGYVLLYDFEPHHSAVEEISLDEVSDLSTSVDDSLALLAAFDNSLATRWASSRPQAPGMSVTITFKEPTVVRAIQYQLGGWKHDYPRKLKITGVLNGKETELLTPYDFHALAYSETMESLVYLPHPQEVEAVILEQGGSHPMFDWTIAELNLYRAPESVPPLGTEPSPVLD